MTTVTVLPGDGIGPDIVEATTRILTALDCGLEFEYAIAGNEALKQGLDLVPEETLEKIAQHRAALKGPITTPIGRGFSSVNVSLRQHFDLFANVRPALSIPGATVRYSDIDILVVRENMEGLYAGVGHKRSEDGERAELTSVITRRGSTRVISHAFNLARQA